MRLNNISGLVLCLGACATGLSLGQQGGDKNTPSSKQSQTGNPLLGSWQGEDGTLVRFGTDWATVYDAKKKHLQFYMAEYKAMGKDNEVSVRLRTASTKGVGFELQGAKIPKEVDVTLTPQIQGDILKIGDAGLLAKSTFRKLANVPLELQLQPLAMKEAKPLPPEKVTAIREELARRAKLDQELRRDGSFKDPDKKADARKKDLENIRYIIGLVKEVGWIDGMRFGPEAAGNALLLAHHSGDVSLMMAGLPVIEKDIKGGRMSFMGSGLYTLFVVRLDMLLSDLPQRKRIESLHGTGEKAPEKKK